MKKSLLICILAVLLCVSVLFAACAPSLEAETLENMQEILKQLYQDKNPADSYTVTGLVASGKDKASIKWSVTITEGDQNAVKVGAYDEETKHYTIEVDPEPKADVKYTLTATLTNDKGVAYKVDGKDVTVSFERSLKKFVVNSFAEYVAAENDASLIVKGVVVAVLTKANGDNVNGLYIVDNDGGYYIYDVETLPEGIKVGDTVVAKGKKDNYSGTLELKEATVTIKDATTAAPAPKDFTDLYKAAAAKNDLEDPALVGPQAQLVTIKGVTLKEQGGDKGDYFYFELDGLKSYIRISSSVCPLNAADTEAFTEKFLANYGKKADVTGVICVYSGKFYLTPVDLNAISNLVEVSYTDAEKVAMAKENLALESAITEPKSIDLPATGSLGTTITWAFAEGTTADFITIADGKLTVSALPDSTTEVTVIATITSGSVSETKEFKVSVAASLIMSETRAYAGYVNQVKASKELYLDGGVSGRYLTTTTDASKAVAIYAEKATGGYKFYILDGETKKYITVYSNSDNKTSVNYDAAGETVYTYNPVVNALTTTFNGSEVYLGTYNTFETISVSNLSYITAENTGVEQFPLELLAAVDGASYTASLKQVKLEGKTLYLDGGVSGRYLTTTEDAKAAATVYAEKVAGGFKFYILDGETKKYINLYNNTDNKLSVNYDENGTSVFAYNATVNAWVTIFSETEYYLGTYNTFNTVSASKLSYITAENTGVEQFPLELLAAGGETPAHECTSVCAACGKCKNATCEEAVCEAKCAGHTPVVVNVSDITTTGEFKTEQTLAEGVTVLAKEGKSIKINSNNKSIDGFSFTQRLQLGGSMAQDCRVIKVETSGAATITIYAISSSSEAGQERNMLLKDSAFETVGTQVVGLSIGKVEYTVTAAGTYYLGSESSGINVYYIAISYGAEDAEVGGGETPAHECTSICATCGKCTDKDCTETVCSEKCEGHEPVVVKGTKENPYTVAEALVVANGLSKGQYTEMVYVKGAITSIGSRGSYLSNVYIADSAEGEELLVYSCNYTDAVSHVCVGDTVVIYGAIINYNGTLELSRVKDGDTVVHPYPTFDSLVSRGTSTITVGTDSSANATVAITNNATSGENNSTFTFTVSVEAGHKLVSVKVNGEAVTANEGLYTSTVCGNTVIVVNTVAEGETPATETKYTFSSYTAGAQYAEGEEHKLDDNVTVTTTQCHFTSELRIYSSSTHNGFAVFAVNGTVKSIALNAGNKADNLVVYGSTDGQTWTEIGKIATTSAYADYTLSFGDTAYSYFKLDVEGSQQVRVANITISYIPAE